MQDQQSEPLVKLIVEEVQRALRPAAEAAASPSSTLAGGDVFCLFYESRAGLESVGRQLGMLQERGITLGCLLPEYDLSEPFQRIRWNDTVRAAEAGGFAGILKSYGSYLVVNLSRRGLAELATGVTVSAPSELIYLALGQRSRVTAIRDPLTAERVESTQDPVHLASVQVIVNEHLERVQRLGVDLIPCDSLFEHLAHQIEHESQAVDALKGFVTLEDVEGHEGREIRVVRGTRLTPLAEDWLRDHGIQIRFVDP